MKRPLYSLLGAALLLLGSVPFASAGWTTNFADAAAKAKADNKAILLDFTGSDWCEWCMKMKSEVFDTGRFMTYANKNLVLVTVDFPQGITQPAAVVAQNQKLQKKYRQEAYPTFILLSPDGNRVLAKQEGYLQGGPDAFLNWINKSYHPAPNAASSGDDFDSAFKKSGSK